MSEHAPGWRPFLALCLFCPLLCLTPSGSLGPTKGEDRDATLCSTALCKREVPLGRSGVKCGFFVGYVPVEIKKKKKKIQRGRFDLFRKQ